VRALLAAALVLAPGVAGAQQPVFAVRNATKAPIRCMLMEGGPITQLVTIQPGREHVERIAHNQLVSLACPKVREVVFGPLAPGRYVFQRGKAGVELARLP